MSKNKERSEKAGVREVGEDLYPEKLFDTKDMPVLVSQKPLKLTHAKAKELSLLDVYANQRSKKPHLLDFIEKTIRSGLWYGNKIAVAELDFDYELEDGTIVRRLVANGGHTIRVHLDNPDFVTENTLLIFQCPNINALAILYSIFDRPESSRSARDQCKAFIDVMPDPELWRVDGALSSCSTAVAVVEHGLQRYSGVTKVASRVALLKTPKYYRHAVFVRNLLYSPENGGIKQNRFMAKGQCVMSAIVATHIIDAKAAATFWEDVRSGVMLPPKSPQLALRNFLLASKAGGGVSSVTLYAMLYRCHQAWNAFCENKKMPKLVGRIGPELPRLLSPKHH